MIIFKNKIRNHINYALITKKDNAIIVIVISCMIRINKILCKMTKICTNNNNINKLEILIFRKIIFNNKIIQNIKLINKIILIFKFKIIIRKIIYNLTINKINNRGSQNINHYNINNNNNNYHISNNNNNYKINNNNNNNKIIIRHSIKTRYKIKSYANFF